MLMQWHDEWGGSVNKVLMWYFYCFLDLGGGGGGEGPATLVSGGEFPSAGNANVEDEEVDNDNRENIHVHECCEEDGGGGDALDDGGGGGGGGDPLDPDQDEYSTTDDEDGQVVSAISRLIENSQSDNDYDR